MSQHNPVAQPSFSSSNNNNNRKHSSICGFDTTTIPGKSQTNKHNLNNTSSSSSSSSTHYCDFLLKLTKAALSLSFLLTVSLFVFAAFSSLPSAPSSAFSAAATRFFFPPSSRCNSNLTGTNPGPIRPDNLLFALSGSAKTWKDRRKYSLLWWSLNVTRGFVWLDKDPPPESVDTTTGPPIRVSSLPGRAKKAGIKDSDRLARLLKESFEVGAEGVRWLVMGDDDTVFMVENLVSVLTRYDDREMYYVGGNSESVEQDEMHSYGTAFGGGGFAVSYPLACELVRILDGCIERYHSFWGSDEKVAACVSELGVPLTRHPGFHQFDIRGDPYGLLAAHPVAPLVSLHHLDHVKPLFPGETQVDSLKKLLQAYRLDPGLTVQQSICYDHRRKWSISISWGYSVQLYPSLLSSRVLSTPLRTFHTWRSFSDGPFVFNTRPLSGDQCERPIIYYLDQIQDVGDGKTVSIYKRVAAAETNESCKQSAYKFAMAVEKIVVTASKTGPDKWLKAPRRECCEITNTWIMSSSLKVKIRRCKPSETMSI